TLLVQAGLFFSLIGDVFLMLDHLDEFNFLIGLSAFLIAHI
ncbi:MAG: lysoplasmalogenase, partial [Flavobacteriales bacterium]|nr:lysoplasmalogenase [Flavobacteriales bacterium]